MPRLREEKGMVLLMVLVIVALLASLLTEFAFSTLVDLRLTETFRDNTRAWYLAKGGVQAGRMILQMNRNGYDHPGEIWAQGIPAYPVGENGAVAIDIEDLNSRLNVNLLVLPGQNVNLDVRGALERLFTQIQQDHPDAFPDTPQEMAAALFDWIDSDDAVTRQPGTGAESAYYQGLERPYPAKNGPLDTIEELQMVKGFTPEGYRLLAPFLTVHGRGVMNINTAPPEVLMAFHPDVDPPAADRIVQFREKEPFKSMDDLKQLLGQQSLAYSGLASQRTITSGVKSTHFLITASAEVADGRRTATAAVDSTGQTVYYLKVD